MYICTINFVLLVRVESALTYIICFLFQAMVCKVHNEITKSEKKNYFN